MKCPNCKNELAIIDPIFGVLNCNTCNEKQGRLKSPGKQVEFTSESIKQQRKEYADDILQPYRKGELSKEYIKKYGTKTLKGVTKEEIKHAKNVWGDNVYYHDN